MAEKTYRIGEAAARLNLKSYVLRFWESEFPQLAPLRTRKGQRLYTERDLALLRAIQTLLHTQGMTIEGAKRYLSRHPGYPAALRSGLESGAPGAVPAPSQDAPQNPDARHPASGFSLPPFMETARPERRPDGISAGERQKVVAELRVMGDILRAIDLGRTPGPER